MRKIIAFVLLITLLIPVFVFSASADIIPVSGCYYIDGYVFCDLLIANFDDHSFRLADFQALLNQYAGVEAHLNFYADCIGIDCIKYNDRFYFYFETVNGFLGLRFSPSDFPAVIEFDGYSWVSLDIVLDYDFDFYPVDPWSDVAPFITVVPEYNGIVGFIPDSGIDSVLDYILVILPFAVGALVTYISVRKGVGYLRTVLNRS